MKCYEQSYERQTFTLGAFVVSCTILLFISRFALAIVGALTVYTLLSVFHTSSFALVNI